MLNFTVVSIPDTFHPNDKICRSCNKVNCLHVVSVLFNNLSYSYPTCNLEGCNHQIREMIQSVIDNQEGSPASPSKTNNNFVSQTWSFIKEIIN